VRESEFDYDTFGDPVDESKTSSKRSMSKRNIKDCRKQIMKEIAYLVKDCKVPMT